MKEIYEIINNFLDDEYNKDIYCDDKVKHIKEYILITFGIILVAISVEYFFASSMASSIIAAKGVCSGLKTIS